MKRRLIYGSAAPQPPLRPFRLGRAVSLGLETGQCAEAGCDKPAKGRRLCAMHVSRKKKAAAR